MSPAFRVGFVQSRPRLFRPRENLAACLRAMEGKRADLWVLPELATSGYVFKSRREVAAVAEEIPAGPTCSALREFARARRCAVVCGLPERSGRRYFNSAVLATPDKIVVYRKVHLFADEKKWFSPGSEFPVAEVFGVKVGLMVCFDWFFPESCRTLALKGAQVIAHPANLVLPWAPEAMKTRCLENRVFAVTANRVGSERGLRFIGRSEIVSPRGEVLVRASRSKPEACVVPIDPRLALDKKVTPANDLFKDRRPQAYLS